MTLDAFYKTDWEATLKDINSKSTEKAKEVALKNLCLQFLLQDKTKLAPKNDTSERNALFQAKHLSSEGFLNSSINQAIASNCLTLIKALDSTNPDFLKTIVELVKVANYETYQVAINKFLSAEKETIETFKALSLY